MCRVFFECWYLHFVVFWELISLACRHESTATKLGVYAKSDRVKWHLFLFCLCDSFFLLLLLLEGLRVFFCLFQRVGFTSEVFSHVRSDIWAWLRQLIDQVSFHLLVLSDSPSYLPENFTRLIESCELVQRLSLLLLDRKWLGWSLSEKLLPGDVVRISHDLL